MALTNLRTAIPRGGTRQNSAHHSAPDRKPSLLQIAVYGFLGSSLVFKSFLFRDGEPVIVNYAYNAVALACFLAVVLARAREAVIQWQSGVLVGLAVVWTFFSAVYSGIALNVAAVAALTVLVTGFALILPLVIYWTGQESWRIILHLLSVITLISLAMLVVVPGEVTDVDSGRFAGAYVSVAVACTLFAFNALLAVRAAMVAQNTGRAAAWLGIATLASVFLYLTRTRSSLSELLAGLLLLLLFSPMQRGLRMVALTGTAMALVFALLSAEAVSTGVVSIDQQLQDFRLANGGPTDARNDNWSFGIERIIAKPLFGEGLLAKQTQGGTSNVDFQSASSYDVRYDPHSLALSFGVQGGVPFMLLMGGLLLAILFRFVLVFGVRSALQSPEFILVSLRLLVSLFSGGDMTTLGNVVEKITWLLIGTLALKTELQARQLRRTSAGSASARWYGGANPSLL